jgi:outer membrane protein assembly factor BamA
MRKKENNNKKNKIKIKISIDKKNIKIKIKKKINKLYKQLNKQDLLCNKFENMWYKNKWLKLCLNKELQLMMDINHRE